MNPTALIVRAPGTNRDHDVAYALTLAGASTTIVSLAALTADPKQLEQAQIVVLAGGFSYADSLGAGALAGLQLNKSLGDDLRSFVASGRPIIGICNGFQMLVRSGLLPGSLTRNDHGNFVCKWVTLESPTPNRSIWTSTLPGPIECPVAHGEGRYVADADTVGAHTALRYVSNTNPNGSVNDVAGVTDSTGLILGLMPHPENHVLNRQHPRFHRGEHQGLARSMFDAGVAHVKGRG
jgi:phosphoribosylformylglycinamidine synthase subunit PurQ / glutaminase